PGLPASSISASVGWSCATAPLWNSREFSAVTSRRYGTQISGTSTSVIRVIAILEPLLEWCFSQYGPKPILLAECSARPRHAVLRYVLTPPSATAHPQRRRVRAPLRGSPSPVASAQSRCASPS